MPPKGDKTSIHGEEQGATDVDEPGRGVSPDMCGFPPWSFREVSAAGERGNGVQPYLFLVSGIYKPDFPPQKHRRT